MLPWGLIFFFSVFPLFLIYLIHQFFKSNTRISHGNRLPSPPKLPIIGHLHRIGAFPHLSLHSMAQKCGPLMMLHFGSVPVLVVSSADGAREIMKTHDQIFLSRPKNTVATKLSYQGKDVAFPPYGQYWREMRSVCVLHLLSNKRVQSYRALREEETTCMIEKIRRCTSLVNLSEMIAGFTNDVVCRATLGKKYGEDEEGRKFKELAVEFVSLLVITDVGDYLPWLRWVGYLNGLYTRLDRAVKKFDTFIERVLEDHMAENCSQKSEGALDFVDVLLQLQRENTTTFPIERDSIKGIISNLLTAGTDTTSVALEWAMTELLRSPRALKKIQTEVRDIGRGKPSITEDDLSKMQYLKAVMKESLRLHPPLPLLVPRSSTQRVEVMGYDIAEGTQVIVNAWAIGRDPSVWDDPNEFRPERFLNSSLDVKGKNFELIPFSAGRRGCPGASFAMANDELAMANLVYNFDLSLPDGASGNDLDMSEEGGITVRKRLPLLVIATQCSF